MKSAIRLISCFLVPSLALASSAIFAESFWQNPVIQGYGKVHPMPEAAVQPSPDREYKTLFDATRASGTPSQANRGFEHIVRLINLFALAKIPPEKLKIHRQTTAIALDDRHYREKHQFDNPDGKLIGALKRAGIIVYVCGQGFAHNGFEPARINPEGWHRPGGADGAACLSTR